MVEGCCGVTLLSLSEPHDISTGIDHSKSDQTKNDYALSCNIKGLCGANHILITVSPAANRIKADQERIESDTCVASAVVEHIRHPMRSRFRFERRQLILPPPVSLISLL